MATPSFGVMRRASSLGAMRGVSHAALVTLPDGARSVWDFNGLTGVEQSIPDVINGYDLRRGSTAVLDEADPGLSGGGATFDGSNDYLYRAYDMSLEAQLGGEATLMALVDVDGSTAHTNRTDKQHHIIGWRDFYMRLRTFASQPGAGYFITSYAVTSANATRGGAHTIPSLMAGRTLLSLVLTPGGTLQPYVNSTALSANTGAAFNVRQTNMDFTIGALQGTSMFSDFPVYWAAFFNRALAQSEIKQTLDYLKVIGKR